MLFFMRLDVYKEIPLVNMLQKMEKKRLIRPE